MYPWSRRLAVLTSRSMVTPYISVMVPQALLAHKVQKEILAQQAPPEQRVLPEQRERPEPLAQQALPALPVLLEQRGPRVQLVPPDLLEQPERQVIQEIRVLKVILVLLVQRVKMVPQYGPLPLHLLHQIIPLPSLICQGRLALLQESVTLLCIHITGTRSQQLQPLQ